MTYRLIAIDGDTERDAGLVDTLEMPADAILTVSLPPETLEMDMVRIRHEMRTFLDSYPAWRGRPIGVIRAGDVKFLRLVPVEVSDT